MHKLIVPSEVKFSELLAKKSLSPNNYKKLTIKNSQQKPLSEFLNPVQPFTKGFEPGSNTYVEFSKEKFLRNSCINNIRVSVEKEKYIGLNPKYASPTIIQNEDILLCTDANIGDSALFITDGEEVSFSSGVVRLNFKNDDEKLYVFAFLLDDYFREQLLALTPKGSTIKHCGDLFLNCLIPICSSESIKNVISNLIRNIAYAERLCKTKLEKAEQLISTEVFTKNFPFKNASFSMLSKAKRLDSGFFSDEVMQWKQNITHYKNGYASLDEFGFKTFRGPSLQKRDLGRSIQIDEYRKGYNLLIYPSDINSSGYIDKVTYLGARNRVWFLTEKYILFSSEGTIGKTFIICDNSMKFTTNIHGTMIYPKDPDTDINKSIFLGLYLHCLRIKGVLSKISVGANGGSFAVGYWDNILIPKVTDDFMTKVGTIYNSPIELDPTEFEKNLLEAAGIYQLNNFIIKCKALLSIIRDDIKNDSVDDVLNYKKFSF